MDIEKHKNNFEKIVNKYGFSEDKKAEEISKYLTCEKNISADNFADKFKIKKNEAYVFLSFIQKGIKFKEKHIDKEVNQKPHRRAAGYDVS